MLETDCYLDRFGLKIERSFVLYSPAELTIVDNTRSIFSSIIGFYTCKLFLTKSDSCQVDLSSNTYRGFFVKIEYKFRRGLKPTSV
jgi:hypothetical protein